MGVERLQAVAIRSSTQIQNGSWVTMSITAKIIVSMLLSYLINTLGFLQI